MGTSARLTLALVLLGAALSTEAEAKGKPAPAKPPAAATATPPSGVKLFQRGKRPELIPEGLQLPAAVVRGKLDRGRAAQAFLGWLAARKARFGLRAVDGEVLSLRAVHRISSGFSLRFVQRHARLHLEEAEAIALFDAAGALRAVSSSLVPTPKLLVRAELNEKDALRAAAKKYPDIDPLPRSPQDGLLIAREQAGLALVWQFPLRDRKTQRPFQVQVLAAGARKGQLLNVRPLDSGNAPVRIHDGFATAPGPLLLDSGTPSADGLALQTSSAPDFEDAEAAGANFSHVLDFYATLGRNGWDDAGAPVVASIRVQSCQGNAYWSFQAKAMTFCKEGRGIRTLEKITDIVGHELTHGVIDATSKLTYQGESGGLNEHLADMFGSVVLHSVDAAADSFGHGFGALAASPQPIRAYLDPHQSHWAQPATMDEVRAGRWSGGPFLTDRYRPTLLDVHILSAIPNRAISLAAKKVSWEPLGKLLYRVMTARLRADSTFVDYRDQVADECRTTLPAETCAAIGQGFDEVGVLATAAPAVAEAPIAAPQVSTPAALPARTRQPR